MKLNFKPCWVVRQWAKEIEKGKGVNFTYTTEYYGEKDDVLFENSEGKLEILKKNKCFFDEGKARIAFLNTKKEYKEFLQREINNYTEKLNNL